MYPAGQPRLRAEGGHLVARNRQHQPAPFAFGGFARLGEQRVNLRLQFRRARFFAENPRQGFHLLLAAGADIAVVHRQVYGGRVFRQLFIRFRARPAGNDKLRIVAVQCFVIGLEQRPHRCRLVKCRLQIVHAHRRGGCAHVHAQLGQRIQRRPVVHGDAFGILRHNGITPRGRHGQRGGRCGFGCGGYSFFGGRFGRTGGQQDGAGCPIKTWLHGVRFLCIRIRIFIIKQITCRNHAVKRKIPETAKQIPETGKVV